MENTGIQITEITEDIILDTETFALVLNENFYALRDRDIILMDKLDRIEKDIKGIRGDFKGIKKDVKNIQTSQNNMEVNVKNIQISQKSMENKMDNLTNLVSSFISHFNIPPSNNKDLLVDTKKDSLNPKLLD